MGDPFPKVLLFRPFKQGYGMDSGAATYTFCVVYTRRAVFYNHRRGIGVEKRRGKIREAGKGNHEDRGHMLQPYGPYGRVLLTSACCLLPEFHNMAFQGI